MSMLDGARSLALTSILLIPFTVFAQPAYDWSVSFGGPPYDLANAVAADDDGNVWISGSLNSPTGSGYTHAYIAKLDPSGVLLWSKTFGAGFVDLARGIDVDSLGNSVVVGGFVGTIDFGGGPLTSAGGTDVFVACFDDAGEHRWSKRFGSSSREVGYDVAAGGDGSFTVVGSFNSTIDFGGGPFWGTACTCGFVVRFDGDGNHVWSRQKKLDGAVYANRSLALRPDGRAYVALARDACYTAPYNAASVMAYSSSGDSIWETGTSLESVADVTACHDGGVAVAGWNTDVNTEMPEPVLAKYDADKTQQWQRTFYTFGIENSFFFRALATNTTGDIIGVGELRGSVDFGDGTLTSAGDYDAAFLKVDANGDNPKSFRFGSTGKEDPLAVVGTQPGRSVVTGLFTGSFVLGEDTLSSAGNTDIFVTQVRYQDFVSVAISEFRVESDGGGVRLRGRFVSDLSVDAVNVYRARGLEPWRRIAVVQSGVSDRFEFQDNDVAPGCTYRYQIGVVDADGEFFSPIETVAIPIMASALEQNLPNPFNPTTAIRFNLALRARATITIWNAEGRRIRTLVDEALSHGPHEVIWDGRDQSGVSVSSGVYFYRLTAGKFVDSKKMVLLK